MSVGVSGHMDLLMRTVHIKTDTQQNVERMS